MSETQQVGSGVSDGAPASVGAEDKVLEAGPGAESPVVAGGVAGGDSHVDGSWDQCRWERILDRMEFRQAGIGLRFWGPPVWLEVTMTGPDSDRWWAAAAGDVLDQSWNWHSNTSCIEAMHLAFHRSW